MRKIEIIKYWPIPWGICLAIAFSTENFGIVFIAISFPLLYLVLTSDD